jgi:hypothetical protein
MRLIHVEWYLRVCGLGLLLVAGCTETSALVQVSGKVLVDGKPAEGASVLFFPQPTGSTNGAAGDVAAGATDASGQYSLLSNMERGIAPGSYKITVSWPEPPKKDSKLSVMGDIKDPPDLLRGRYSDPNRSKLTADITEATVELPPLELTTK